MRVATTLIGLVHISLTAAPNTNRQNRATPAHTIWYTFISILTVYSSFFCVQRTNPPHKLITKLLHSTRQDQRAVEHKPHGREQSRATRRDTFVTRTS